MGNMSVLASQGERAFIEGANITFVQVKVLCQANLKDITDQDSLSAELFHVLFDRSGSTEHKIRLTKF